VLEIETVTDFVVVELCVEVWALVPVLGVVGAT
jgi:hypothetical protein